VLAVAGGRSGERRPVGRALPPAAERQDDLGEEPAPAAAGLLLPRDAAAAAAGAAGAGAPVASAVLRGALQGGVGRDLAGVVVAAAVDAEVLEARETAAQVRRLRRPARHVQDVGQVPALHHHVVHLQASMRACVRACSHC
jgi:hypothetical protein